MDAPTRQRLRGGFDSAATQYADSRPGYPPEAVDWLVPGAPCDVLDLGAGSGALTRLLAGVAHRVVAAEPSRNLLAELRETASGVAMVQAAAEALPFSADSFDAVTVATAFHWFDHDRALPEIARVLRPGGRLGLTWNTRVVGSAWTTALDDLLRSAQPPSLQGDWGTDSERMLTASPLFAPTRHAEFRHEQRLDGDGLVGLVASRSYVIALPTPDRERVLAEVRHLFEKHAGPAGVVELPYVCQCWRARVRGKRPE